MPRTFCHRVMYIAPSSGHISLNFNMPLKLILRRFEVVFWCLGRECCTFWKIDGNSFKSTNTILLHGFNSWFLVGKVKYQMGNNFTEWKFPFYCRIALKIIFMAEKKRVDLQCNLKWNNSTRVLLWTMKQMQNGQKNSLYINGHWHL